jgi:hypothetical protein
MTDYDALYPEHAKLKLIAEQSQVVGEFMDWLGEKDIALVSFADYRDDGIPVPWRPLLAEYFGIDEKVIEQEKRAMLDAIRAANP